MAMASVDSSFKSLIAKAHIFLAKMQRFCEIAESVLEKRYRPYDHLPVSDATANGRLAPTLLLCTPRRKDR